MRSWLFQFLTVAGLTLAAGNAAAAISISSGQLGPGFSKDNQISSTNGASSLGAAVNLSFDIVFTSTTQATITAHLKNTGAGVVTAFGFDLFDYKDDDKDNTGFEWSIVSKSFRTANANCAGGAGTCSFSNGASGISGLISDADLSSGADAPKVKKGLESNESIDLIWDVTGNFSTITSTTAFSSLVSPTSVAGKKGFAFTSFWVAHIQALSGGASDKIGGGSIPTPEPSTILGLLVGLVGLGWARSKYRAPKAAKLA
jgi:hypothetical protein